MPSGDDTTVESFRGLVLQLRGRSRLTQRELAARVGVNVSSVQGWESGDNYPGIASLKALIEAGLEVGGFTAGRERDEARALWAAALRDAPRFRTPFDGAWFERLVAGPREPVQHVADRAPEASPAGDGEAGPDRAPRRESWGEAPDIAGFLNRTSERALLRQWVLDEGSRLVAVLGLGGIGKSLLAARLAHDLAPSFERVFWRSLRDAPSPDEWLAEAMRFLAPDDVGPPQSEAGQVRRLLELLRDARCLLVLDNFETVLQAGGRAGDYRPGYERYGALLRQLGEGVHQSCLAITSREEPLELGPLRGERGRVRVLTLAGLGVEDGRALLDDKRLDGDEVQWRALVGRYGGNGLALRIVGETTREVFGGSIADYLDFATQTSGVMVDGVRQLLGAQIQRLSDLEVELLRRLAVAREPVGLMDLVADLGPRFGRAATLEAVEALRRRSLLERTERGPLFGLHSVVLEFVTDQLVEEVAQELTLGEPDHLLRLPLLKATGKDYVRRSQERLIVGPLVERLVEARGGVRAAEQRLLRLLDRQRGRPARDQGYGPGNLVNLLRSLRGDLKGLDLSDLAIRQAYLQDVEAHGASLAGADLAESVLAEAFSHPASVTLSLDGAFLAAGMMTGEVCRWRVPDRTLVATWQAHTGAVWGLAQRADGRLLASGGADGLVRLWDGESGRPLASLDAHPGGVRDVALSEDGRLLASAGVDGTVRLWDAERHLPLMTLHGHDGEVFVVALSADGGVVASGGLDRTVRLWDSATGRSLAIMHGHTGGVRGVALTPDGRLVASGGLDATVRLWEADGGRPLATFHGHSGGVRGVALTRDGRSIVSGGFDGVIRIWDPASDRPQSVLTGHVGLVPGVALSGDGRLLASGGFDGTMRIWEVESGLPLAILHGHIDRLWDVGLSRDGRLVASGSFGGTVRVWETETELPSVALLGHTRIVPGVAVSGDGRLVASSSWDGTVRLWDTASGRQVSTLIEHPVLFLGTSMSADGRLAASGAFDGLVRLWETASGRLIRTLQGHTGPVRGVALSGDGRLIATGSVDSTVRVWESASGRMLSTLHGHSGEVYSVCFGADSRLLVSSGLDTIVRLWDTSSGALLVTMPGHTAEVYCVALSEDGRLIVSGSLDGTVRLWEAASGRPLAVMQGHLGGVWGVALDADAQVVASSGDDGTVRLWDVRSGTLRRTLRLERRYEALDITGLTGITDAQRVALLTLGAVDRSDQAAPAR